VKSVSISAVSFYLLAANQIAFASPNDRCTLPSGLRDEISNKDPGTKLVGLADVDEI
jgi:hypothetical protein